MTIPVSISQLPAALDEFGSAQLLTLAADGSVRVDCTIYVSRATQKAILIGDKGSRIRAIGQSARIELSKLLERPVHLFLNVKEREGWDEERARIRAIGLDDAG